MKHWREWFRLVGAVALLLAFFLPVSSCSSDVGSDQDEASTGSGDVVEVTNRRYRHPYKLLTIDEPGSLLILVAYLWPVCMFGYRKLRPANGGLKRPILEIILCLFSIWLVWTLGYLYTRETGSYVAFAGATLYLFAAFAETTASIRERRSA